MTLASTLRELSTRARANPSGRAMVSADVLAAAAVALDSGWDTAGGLVDTGVPVLHTDLAAIERRLTELSEREDQR